MKVYESTQQTNDIANIQNSSKKSESKTKLIIVKTKAKRKCGKS